MIMLMTHNDLSQDACGRRSGDAWIRFAVLLTVGIIIRVLLIGWFAGQPLQVGDEKEYNAIALNLATRGEFATAPGDLTSIRPPLYPAMVAGVYRLFGLENYTAVRIVNVGLGLLTTFLIWRLACAMYGPRVGIGAASVACFYPSLLAAENLLLTEALFTCLMAASCWLLQRYLASGSLGYLSGFGFTLGLATLTRSVLWVFPPFLLLYLVFAARTPALSGAATATRLVAWSRRLRWAIVPLVVFGLVIAPWSIRNTRLQKTFTTIDDMGGRNFMMGNYEYTPMFRAWDAISIRGDQAWFRILASEHAEFPDLTQGQKDKLAMKRGLKFVFANPVLTAQRDVIKFFNFWQLERSTAAGLSRGFWGGVPRIGVIAIAGLVAGVYVVVLTLGIFGFLLTRPTDVRMHWFLLLLVGFVCAVHSAVFGHERYHVPFMPFLGIYAAAAVVSWRVIWQQRGTRMFVLATTVVALLVTSWVAGLVLVDLKAMGAMDLPR